MEIEITADIASVLFGLFIVSMAMTGLTMACLSLVRRLRCRIEELIVEKVKADTEFLEILTEMQELNKRFREFFDKEEVRNSLIKDDSPGLLSSVSVGPSLSQLVDNLKMKYDPDPNISEVPVIVGEPVPELVLPPCIQQIVDRKFTDEMGLDRTSYNEFEVYGYSPHVFDFNDSRFRHPNLKWDKLIVKFAGVEPTPNAVPVEALFSFNINGKDDFKTVYCVSLRVLRAFIKKNFGEMKYNEDLFWKCQCFGMEADLIAVERLD